MTTITLEQCAAEIQRLHDFFQDWFTSVVPESDEEFHRFAAAMDTNFAIIGPNGALTELPALTAGLRNAYGKQPKIRIWTENHRRHHQWGNVALCTYEEWQAIGDKTTVRLSSVLLRKEVDTPHGLSWLHVHETWIAAA